MKGTKKMKRNLLFLVALLLCILVLASCGGNDGDGGTKLPENTIYVEGVKLFVIKDDHNFPNDMMSSVITAVQKATGVAPEFRMSTVDKADNEIVIGNTSRPVSVTAMELLPELTHSTTNFLIYSDGSSLALVFNDDNEWIAAEEGVKYLIENCLSESTYVHTPGVIHVGEVDLDEYYQAKDDAMVTERWAALEAYVGGELGKNVANAFRDLYKLYDDEVIVWFANLYAPRKCVCKGECQGTPECSDGGYYYSNSARDTAGYLPDAESTSQALNFIQSSGMGWHTGSYAKTIPEWMKNEISDFIYYLQDPDDGYFYHPQWGKSIPIVRRGRDLSWCTSMLNSFGRKPRYASITSTAAALTRNLGTSAAVAVSGIVGAASTLDIPSHLVDEESFRAYLDNYSPQMATRSYSIGSELTSQSNRWRGIYLQSH